MKVRPFTLQIPVSLLILVMVGEGQDKSFEVASIRPAAPYTIEDLRAGKVNIGVKIDGAQADYRSVSLTTLVMLAFGVKPYQVQAADWMNSTRFDVAAKMPEGAARVDGPEMLKTLLVERFKLSFHRETRSLPIYALLVGKNGLKMNEVPPGTPFT
jgi:uncharacterized protein (TIGR03435 family)